MVNRNVGVDPRFRVVDAPLDFRFALVWGVGRVPGTNEFDYYVTIMVRNLTQSYV